MSSVVLSAENLLSSGGLESDRAALPVNRPTASWSWLAIGQTASGMLFVAALAWEVWRFGGMLIQCASQVAISAPGGLF